MRRTIAIRGATESVFDVDSSSYEGMTHQQIVEHVKVVAEAYVGSAAMDDDDVELAAYQIRSDLA